MSRIGLEALAKIRHVALDMDGTIYKGSTLFPQTIPFLNQLEDLGLGYTFLTNNPSKNADDYRRHLKKFDIFISDEQVYSALQATLRHLKTQMSDARNVFFLGTSSMIEEFVSHGYIAVGDEPDDEPDVVVVAFDPTLNYSKLCRAAWWISRGKPYFATNPDLTCPTDEPTLLLDCGAICAALTKATGRAPDMVLGKPDPSMLHGILERHDLRPEQVAMVGDRLCTDLEMAHRAGALGVLVLTGECTADDVASTLRAPDLVLPDIGHFGKLLKEAYV